MTTTETTTRGSTWCPATPLGRALPLTDTERADIARWVVAMYRAHQAEVEQARGHLKADDGYCCLGLWCEIATARGQLKVRTRVGHGLHSVEWAGLDVQLDGQWEYGALPGAAYLGGLDDPQVIRLACRDDIGDDAEALEWAALDGRDWNTVSASNLNDDHGLNFSQIADLVVWSYGVTAEELAAAELAPRVTVVEGFASESSRVSPAGA